MAQEYILEAHSRKEMGKKDVKILRSEGKIPGVYYSHDSKESIPFYIETKELFNAFKSDSHLYKVEVGDKMRNVMFKDIQYHPVTDEVIHLDLYGVRMDELIQIKVPIHLIGDCLGEKEDGGKITQPLMELDIKCLPSNIPDFVELDITELRLGDSLHASDVMLADDVELASNPDSVIVSVTHGISDADLETAVLEEEGVEFEDAEGEESAEEGAEGEEKKDE
ncbi:MAG: 50S ribosomal protein L25 [Candidatus Marinimicrobia bacterium]|nr:50S ribosomal protein L25 [Candidatus Neomarinimicrobiota bacterium]MBL7108979.1 50S ribosomal protein L25 [Candidatus Neomarinimicrobiota bacterium]